MALCSVTAQLSDLHGSVDVAKASEENHAKQKPAKKALRDGHHGGRKLTEAQIAVHWKEEEYFQPPAKFIGQANLNDPAIVEKFSEEAFPRMFSRIRRAASLGQVLAHHARHQRSALLEVVRRRQAERLLQLRRSPPRKAQK